MGVVAGEGCRGAEGFCRHSAARKWTGSALRQVRESQAGNLVPDKDNCREGRLEKVRYGCPLAAILASDGRLAGSHHYAPVFARERESSDALEAKRACNVAFIMTFRVANLQNRTLLPAAFRASGLANTPPLAVTSARHGNHPVTLKPTSKLLRLRPFLITVRLSLCPVSAASAGRLTHVKRPVAGNRQDAPDRSRIYRRCFRFAFTDGAGRGWSPPPSCFRSRPSAKASMRRRSRASAPSAPARPSSRSVASTTRRSGCASRSSSQTP